MVSATVIVTYKNGVQETRVLSNVGNAAALLDTLKQAAQQVDGFIPAGTTDGHDAVINVHTIADVQVQAYNGL